MRRVSPWWLAILFVASVGGSRAACGGVALVAVLPLWLLFLAWRFDNHTGSLLLLTVLVLIVMLVMVGLLGLLALQR